MCTPVRDLSTNLGAILGLRVGTWISSNLFSVRAVTTFSSFMAKLWPTQFLCASVTKISTLLRGNHCEKWMLSLKMLLWLLDAVRCHLCVLWTLTLSHDLPTWAQPRMAEMRTRTSWKRSPEGNAAGQTPAQMQDRHVNRNTVLNSRQIVRLWVKSLELVVRVTVGLTSGFSQTSGFRWIPYTLAPT